MFLRKCHLFLFLCIRWISHGDRLFLKSAGVAHGSFQWGRYPRKGDAFFRYCHRAIPQLQPSVTSRTWASASRFSVSKECETEDQSMSSTVDPLAKAGGMMLIFCGHLSPIQKAFLVPKTPQPQRGDINKKSRPSPLRAAPGLYVWETFFAKVSEEHGIVKECMIQNRISYIECFLCHSQTCWCKGATLIMEQDKQCCPDCHLLIFLLLSWLGCAALLDVRKNSAGCCDLFRFSSFALPHVEAVPARQGPLFLQCSARVGSLGFQGICRVPGAERAPLSSTFCGFCYLKVHCEFWARWKLFFTLDKSLISSCSCCGESPEFGSLHGLCWQHFRDVSWMGLFPDWNAVQSSWSPVGISLYPAFVVFLHLGGWVRWSVFLAYFL